MSIGTTSAGEKLLNLEPTAGASAEAEVLPILEIHQMYGTCFIILIKIALKFLHRFLIAQFLFRYKKFFSFDFCIRSLLIVFTTYDKTLQYN